MAYTTIDDPSAYYQTILYTGTGSSGHAITNDGNSDLQPDLVWIKRRDYNNAHVVQDSTRGFSSGEARVLQPDSNLAEVTNGAFVSFDTDGFEVGGTNAASGAYNASGEPFIAWQWKANGGTTTNNTTGYTASVVQANTTSRFSIVTFTTDGSTRTVGHGLGVKPDVIIVKVRSGLGGWIVMTDRVDGSMDYGYLDNVNAFSTINYDAPTSSVFSYNDNNTNTEVAYLWAAVQGYSKFGSYEGNGNVDGPFVYTGFKPAFIMIKNTGSSSSTAWRIWDTKRNPGNLADIWVDANDPDQESESATVNMDILSNGFKPRVNQVSINSSEEAHFYMAFAESPLVTSGGVPATAR